MPDQGVEDYITIDDFSPGIYGDWQASKAQMPAADGAAQVTDTWGCVASPSGGLMPGPRSVQTATQALLEADGANRYPTNENRLVTLAFRNLFPVHNPLENSAKTWGAQDPNAPDFLDKTFVVWGYFYDSGGASNFRQKGRSRVYKFYHDNSTYDIASVQTSALGNLSGIGALYGRGDIDFTRTNKTDPTTPGGPHAIILNTPLFDDNVGSGAAYPDFDTHTTDSQENFVLGPGISSKEMMKVVGHQDRVVGVASFRDDFGSGAETHYTEGLTWSDANNYAGVGGSGSFVNEEPSGIALLASVSASELIVIKNSGGGYAVRGDLESPTIQRLPGLTSVGGMADNRGIITPIGFVYGTRSGIEIWDGGDHTQCISPQLDGLFWIEAPTVPIKYHHTQSIGSFACVYPYVLAPNSFILDLRTQAWFRLNDPSVRVYSWHQPAWAGRFMSMPSFVNAANPTAFDWFDPHQGCAEYKWTSQPLRRTLAKFHQFREVTLVMQGRGRATVTVTGINNESDTADFDINSTTPVVIRRPISVTTMDAVVQIHVTADPSTDPAPRIHRLHLGFNQNRMVARDG